MTYALLFHPGHNRVYFDTSVALSVSEFTIVSAKMPSRPENIRLEEIEGLHFLLFDTADAMTSDDTDILCDLSFLYAIFEISGEGDVRMMKPVRKTRVDFVDDSISQILKYTGKTNRVYTLLGDGEIQEGLVWEAAMSAAHYKLDNLVGILDWNGLQIDGKNENVMTVTPVDEKFKSFGWNVVVIDGHDFEQIFAAFDQARATKGKPTMIIAKTVKGKGVSFMENEAGWHGKAPNAEQIEQAVAELGGEW